MELTKKQDILAMQEIAKNMLLVKIQRCYAQNGVDKFKTILNQLYDILAVIDIERKDKIVVFMGLGENDLLTKSGMSVRGVSTYEQLNFTGDKVLNIELKTNYELIVNEGGVLEEEELRKQAIVYVYTPGGEYFLGTDEVFRLPMLPGCLSYFTIKTFKAVSEALLSYAQNMARESTCGILKTAWNENDRIFLRPGPEHIMRNSLRQYIDGFLRGSTEVRVEQNVDESHPVDIKVTWSNSNKLALIEVKWLGKSIEADQSRITQTYSQSRALDGAKQLVEYLDWNKQRAPHHITKGYLVVFDARRAKTAVGTKAITRKDGLAYQDKDIAYNPVFENHRSDFIKPFRIFLEPVCNIYQ